MLNQLLETMQATQRKPLGTMVSVAVHVCVIAGAAAFTRHSAVALEGPVPIVVRTPIAPADPEPVKLATAHDAVGARTPPGSLRLPPISDVPIDIPTVGLNTSPTNAADWQGTGVPSGTTHSTGDAPVPRTTGDAYFDFQVESVAAAVPGTGAPSYPESLRSAGVDGEALVQFVVDTLGRAEPSSFKVLRSSHDAFGEAVRAALPRMRFLPAELDGRKVGMLVQQPFTFTIGR